MKYTITFTPQSISDHLDLPLKFVEENWDQFADFIENSKYIMWDDFEDIAEDFNIELPEASN